MKNKFLKFAFSTITTLTVTALPVCLLSACSNDATASQENNPNIGVETGDEENRVKYTTVYFHIPEGEDVTYTGKTEITAKVGQQFGTLVKPAVSKYGHKFLHWSKDETTDMPIGDAEKVPDPDTDAYWNLYPVFQDNVTLNQCVGISTIETTNITVTRSSADLDVNLYYTKDYGEEWIPIFDNAEHHTETTVVIPTLNPGENIFLRGDNPNGFSKSANNYVNFSFSAGSEINIMGSIMGLIDKASGTARAIPNDYCFYGLFKADNDSQAAIQYISNTFLDVDTLNDHCYEQMFYGCSNLINAPWLSTNWHNPEHPEQDVVPTYCYNNMFNGCKRLQTLRLSYNGDFENESDNHCFTDWMVDTPTNGEVLFDGTVPLERSTSNIPAQWTVVHSWNPVHPETDPSFEVKCTDPSVVDPDNYVYTVDHAYQFEAVIPEGYSERLTWFSSDSQYLDVNPETGMATPLKATPEGETVSVVAYSKYSMEWWGTIAIKVKDITLTNCLKFTSTLPVPQPTPEPDKIPKTTIAWEYVGDGGTTNLKYSTDGGENWLKFWPGPSSAVTLNYNQTIYIKGDNWTGLNDPATAETEKENAYTHFIIGCNIAGTTGQATVGGKLMALIDDGRGERTTIPSQYCFNHLFYKNDGLTSIDNGFFNATELSIGCFYSMFEECTNLKTAGSGNSIGTEDSILYDYSCTRMFYRCFALQTAPLMPAKEVRQYCCWRMFEFDNSLTASPALPALTAADSCYRMMFQNCTNLSTPGKISLTTLATFCCYQMFYDAGFSVGSSWTEITNYFIHTPDTVPSNALKGFLPNGSDAVGSRYYYKSSF